MIALNPMQLESEILKIRSELEESIPGFPAGKCNEGTKELVERLGCKRVETIYTPRNDPPRGHVIALYEPLGIYIDITPDQFSDDANPKIILFWQSNPDRRYGVSYLNS
jgi:hypothetical protein